MPKRLSLTQESVRDFLESEKKRFEPAMEDDVVFEYVAAQQVLKQFDLDDDETERGHVGGGNDGGYDGIYVFVNDALVTGEDPDSLNVPSRAHVSINFVQAKNATGFSESIIQNWKTSFRNLLNGDSDTERYSAEVIDAFGLIRAIMKKFVLSRLVVEISFWAVSLAEDVHPNLQKQANELVGEVEAIVPSGVKSVAVEFVTAQKLSEAILSTPESVMALKVTKEPLCPDMHSAIATVSLGDFNRFITTPDGKLNKQLFEANIRDYQGNVSVNKAIRATLVNGSDIEFWWLNNGITIIADEVVRGMEDSISLRNPRIVNGLQTSYEINRYCNDYDISGDKRKVLVKCLASREQSTRDAVVEATNKQSAIPPAFLRSLDPIHLKIERYFESHGLYYDRRKSSCRNRGIPASEIVSVPFLGQCLISTVLQQPDYARARPAQILADDGKYGEIFNETVSLDAYLGLSSLALYVKRWLKGSGYSGTVQNDLIFHAMLFLCARQVGHIGITTNDLEGISIPSNDEIKETIETLHRVYEALGGNSVVAKNRKFVISAAEEFGFSISGVRYKDDEAVTV